MNATDAVPSARVVERRGMTRSGRMASLNNYTHSFHMHANDVNESTSDIRLQSTHPIDKMVTRAYIQWILEWNLKQHYSARLLGIGFRSVLDCAGISGISGPRIPKRVSIFKWRKKCLSTNCESSCEESIISRIPGKKKSGQISTSKMSSVFVSNSYGRISAVSISGRHRTHGNVHSSDWQLVYIADDYLLLVMLMPYSQI